MENRTLNEYQSMEIRSDMDRRARPTSPFIPQSLVGSGSHYRRKEDVRKFYFANLYSPFSAAVLVCTLVLSIADAFLTLRLVGEDIHELNPVMDFFLKLGPFQFITAKCFLTAFGMIALLVLKNYCLRQAKARTVAVLLLLPFLYLVLVSYEILVAVSG